MATTRIGRNDRCPCGSGKKYKHCCLEKDQAKARGVTTPTAPTTGTRSVPSPTVTSPRRREKTAEQLRWEAFWKRFEAATVDDRLVMANEAIATDPDFDGDLAFELCSGIHGPLEAAGRYDEIDALFARIERERPEAFAESAHWFALWRAETELHAARGGEVDAMRRLGEYFTEVIESGQLLLDQLRFHGRGELLEPLLAAAWRHVETSGDVLDWAKRNLRDLLVEAIVARHRGRTPSLAADDAALLDEIAPLFESRTEAARSIEPWLTRSSRRWSYDDFAHIRDDESSLRDLLRGFGAALESRHAWSPFRAAMAVDSILRMVVRRLEGPEESRGGRTKLVPPTAANPFAVAPESVDAFFRAHSDLITVFPHALAAALLALPHWATYLIEHGLADNLRARDALRRFFGEAAGDLQRVLLRALEEHRDALAASDVRAFFDDLK